MKSNESIRHKIRSLLRKAADNRGSKFEQSEAKRMAEKLLKKHGWSIDDVRDENDRQGLPDDKFIHIRIPHGGNITRHKVVGDIAMLLFPSVHHFSAWISSTSESQRVEFRGSDEFSLSCASFSWKRLNEEILDTWKVTQKLKSFSSMQAGMAGPICEHSWLRGIQDGYLKEHSRRNDSENPSVGVTDRKRIGPITKKQRCLPVKNDLALARLDVRLSPEYVPPVYDPPIVSEKDIVKMDGGSYDQGRIYGKILWERLNNL